MVDDSSPPGPLIPFNQPSAPPPSGDDRPNGPPRPVPFQPSPDAIKAVLTALVITQGEPLINPQRVVLSIGRSTVEVGRGRRLFFEYIEDELNPFGRLDLIVVDQ